MRIPRTCAAIAPPATAVADRTAPADRRRGLWCSSSSSPPCVAWFQKTKSPPTWRAQWDLKVLGLRRRRAHDLRRTGISLARGDGALEGILKWGTHAPGRDVMSLYTSVEWEKLCAEVAKLRVGRVRGTVVQLPRNTRSNG
jgi:hypothetical protein